MILGKPKIDPIKEETGVVFTVNADHNDRSLDKNEEDSEGEGFENLSNIVGNDMNQTHVSQKSLFKGQNLSHRISSLPRVLIKVSDKAGFLL